MDRTNFVGFQREGGGVRVSAISAIEAMLSPAVLITTSAILAAGLSSMYGAVNDRMRIMAAERLDLRSGADGTFGQAGSELPRTRERIAEIDTQLGWLLRRHRLLGRAVLFSYLAPLVLVMSVIVIAIAIGTRSGALGVVAEILVIGGAATLLAGLWFASRAIIIAGNAVDYEVQRVMSL
jgi:hypothetical protein